MSALDGIIDSPDFVLVKKVKKERLKRLCRFKDQNTVYLRGVSINTRGDCQFNVVLVE